MLPLLMAAILSIPECKPLAEMANLTARANSQNAAYRNMSVMSRTVWYTGVCSWGMRSHAQVRLAQLTQTSSHAIAGAPVLEVPCRTARVQEGQSCGAYTAHTVK